MKIEKDDLIEIDYILTITRATRNDAKRLLAFAQKFIDENINSCSTCSSQIKALYNKVIQFINMNNEQIEELRKNTD